eukprot:4739325-Alexandrium_andersonii.AAC.1
MLGCQLPRLLDGLRPHHPTLLHGSADRQGTLGQRLAQEGLAPTDDLLIKARSALLLLHLPKPGVLTPPLALPLTHQTELSALCLGQT